MTGVQTCALPISSLTEEDTFSSQRAADALTDRPRQQTLIDQVMETIYKEMVEGFDSLRTLLYKSLLRAFGVIIEIISNVLVFYT